MRFLVTQDATNLTAFGRWLWKNRISDAKFANMMAQHLEIGSFSQRTVEKWRYGKRVPDSLNMKAIKALTGVSADSFFEKPTQPSLKGADARLFSEAIAALREVVSRASELSAAIERAEAVIAKAEALTAERSSD
jgi:hypothetical protein